MASERGVGQTGGRKISGVADRHHDRRLSRRTVWEGRPQRVRAPYPKENADSLDPEYRGTRETPWEAGGTTLQA